MLGRGGYADLTEQRSSGRRTAAPPRRAPRPLGGLPRQPRRARRRHADGAGADPAARGRVGRHPPRHHRRPPARQRAHGLADRGQDRPADPRPRRLLADGPAPPARCPTTSPRVAASAPSPASSCSSPCSTADPGGQAQAAALREIGAQCRGALRDSDPSPRSASTCSRAGSAFDDAWDLRLPEVDRPLWAMVGVGGDELSARGLDLARTPQAIIAGPPRSGRSTVLISRRRVAAARWRRGRHRRTPPLPAARRSTASRVCAPCSPASRSARSSSRRSSTRATGPWCWSIDDGELLKDIEAKDYLKALQRTAGDRGRAIVLGGDSDEVGRRLQRLAGRHEGAPGPADQPAGDHRRRAASACGSPARASATTRPPAGASSTTGRASSSSCRCRRSRPDDRAQSSVGGTRPCETRSATTCRASSSVRATYSSSLVPITW